jgi:hypothetical protein
MMKSLYDYAHNIRQIINNPYLQSWLIKDKKNWNKICSSLDTIEDTEYAISEYLNSKDKSLNLGQKYLYVYGILQILFVQQDAVKHILEANNINIIIQEELKKIRDIRNSSIGHPTKRTKNNETYYNYLSQRTLSLSGFTLLSCTGEKTSFQEIDIYNLITIQSKALAKKLNNLYDKLRKDLMNYKEKFENQSLEDMFPDTINYYFGKLFEQIYANNKIIDPSFYLDFLKNNVLREFKTKLIEREIIDLFDLSGLLDMADYTLNRVNELIHGNITKKNQKYDASIYLKALQNQIYDLKELAIKIDEDFKVD